MDYQSWERAVPQAITGDALWRIQAYRLSLYAADLGWGDSRSLAHNWQARAISDQLYRALSSISANIAEGYSRGHRKDRARFYEYALGSARESRDWYYKSRHVLGEQLVDGRLGLLTQIIRLLLRMVPDQRGGTLKEDASFYVAGDALPDGG